VTVYGQTEVVKYLMGARLATGAPPHFESKAVGVDGLLGAPVVRYVRGGVMHPFERVPVGRG
jgi:hypothetical protein